MSLLCAWTSSVCRVRADIRVWLPSARPLELDAGHRDGGHATATAAGPSDAVNALLHRRHLSGLRFPFFRDETAGPASLTGYLLPRTASGHMAHGSGASAMAEAAARRAGLNAMQQPMQQQQLPPQLMSQMSQG